MMRKAQMEKGTSMIELALVLWLILLFAFIGFEAARMLNYYQLAVVLSREVASAAYRDCSVEKEDDNTAVQACLDEIQHDFASFATNLVPGSGFVLSVYKGTPSGGNVARLGISQTGGYTSRFDVDELGNLSQSLIVDHRIVVLGEAFIPFSPILLRFSWTNFNIKTGVLYDVTVI